MQLTQQKPSDVIPNQHTSGKQRRALKENTVEHEFVKEIHILKHFHQLQSLIRVLRFLLLDFRPMITIEMRQELHLSVSFKTIGGAKNSVVEQELYICC